MVTVLALVLAACHAPGGTAGRSRSGPEHSGASAPPATSTTRPTQPVPDHDPGGVVDPPGGHGMSRYTGQTLHWSGCGSGKECATVLAPLDYHKPGDKAVTLKLARKKNADAKHTLFINPGGPGGSGIDFVDSFSAHGIDDDYTVMSWDPRGVGESTPVHCFDSSRMEKFTAMNQAPETSKAQRAWEKENLAFGKTCLKKSGRLLKHISTRDTTRDLNLLRKLVGEEKLNYFGSSYGTSIGAMYATEYPDKVGKMALDGPTAIGDVPQVSQVKGFDRTLNHFATWCAHRNCRLGDSKHDVLASVRKLLNRLASDTIPAGRRELTQTLATTGLAFALYAPPDQWDMLKKGLERALFDHDGSLLLTWADNYNDRDKAGKFGQFNSAFPAIRCRDKKDKGIRGARHKWAKEKKAAPTLGKFFGLDLSCATWPVRATGDIQQPISYENKPPILLLGTTGDPATPYEYAKHMHKALKSSRLVTLKGNGHLAFDQSTCVQRKVRKYFRHGHPPKTDKTCTDGPSK